MDGLDANEIDIAYAREVLKESIAPANPAVSAEVVIEAVATFFSLKPAQLKTKSNARTIVIPRQIAMYLCKEYTGKSLPQIGKDFGGKHHTTVLHSIKKIEYLRKKDSEISSAVNSIENSFHNSAVGATGTSSNS